jgi:hypothetical protein
MMHFNIDFLALGSALFLPTPTGVIGLLEDFSTFS